MRERRGKSEDMKREGSLSPWELPAAPHYKLIFPVKSQETSAQLVR